MKVDLFKSVKSYNKSRKITVDLYCRDCFIQNQDFLYK